MISWRDCDAVGSGIFHWRRMRKSYERNHRINAMIRLLAIAALLLTPSIANAAPKNDPVAIVNAIYKGQIKRYSPGAPFLDARERKGVLSQSLSALWTEADKKSRPGEVGPIDFDVTTNSQGADVKRFKVEVEKKDRKKATVVATLTLNNWIRTNPDDNIIRYEFVNEKGRWLIDDIGRNNDGKTGTLRELLNESLKAP